jgi:hypothetical protein
MQLTTDKQARKERPIARGVLDYFGKAIAEVAHVSYVGNEQHNPGQPMHWARNKSTDHADCAARHLIERGTIDAEGLRHSAKLAWRALALLQLEIEADERKAAEPQVGEQTVAAINGSGNIEVTGDYEYDEARRIAQDEQPHPTEQRLLTILFNLGVNVQVAEQILRGTSASASCHDAGFVYIAGPMRGYDQFNFPAFDHARDDFARLGYVVTSPADIDRADHKDAANMPAGDQKVYAYRDFATLLMLAYTGKGNIAMLRGWEHSTGATAEFFLARWLGLAVLDSETGDSLDPSRVVFSALEKSVRHFLMGQWSK